MQKIIDKTHHNDILTEKITCSMHFGTTAADVHIVWHGRVNEFGKCFHFNRTFLLQPHHCIYEQCFSMMFTCTLPLPQSLSHFIISAFNFNDTQDFTRYTFAKRVNSSFSFDLSLILILKRFTCFSILELRIMCHFATKQPQFWATEYSECFDARLSHFNVHNTT